MSDMNYAKHDQSLFLIGKAHHCPECLLAEISRLEVENARLRSVFTTISTVESSALQTVADQPKEVNDVG